MKRGRLLLLSAVPLVATAVFFITPGSSEDPGPADERPRTGQDAERRDGEGLAAPEKKELAQQIVASAENSTLNWRSAYAYIEDIGDGQGYTAGIIGFCTGTHDLLTVVEAYTEDHPDNGLARYLPALREVDGTDSHEGLDPGFPTAWRKEASVPAFRRAQDAERDRVYFDPAVRRAGLDGLGTLGQFIYYDAMVMHGPGTSADGFYGLRTHAMAQADTPAEGGSEKAYLDIFLDVRREAMKSKDAHRDTTRIDTAQRRFLYDGNLNLDTPLVWSVYGETYKVP
ncbi:MULTISPECIES: chitosanase [Streptomyces]|uniref:Chitosanase n=1 Tax=Streptomyces dengpaensis TaxID=2049881 RepID=A0ABM6SWX1_9ACTN|nr:MULTISPECIES: chitosanase [Streptomyces]AVH59292.1 chitosanase [Streptomyces dengpaensis]PIB08789.1 chitosanase [Streptomyces sp. HG99]